MLPSKEPGDCQKSIKPIIRWAGSKRKLMKVLLPLVPSTFNRYFEPFAGSACLFFALCPNKAVLNDINPELIHFYKSLQLHGITIYHKATSYARTKEQYLSLRNLIPETLDETDRAARFFFLNRFCFNGLYRTNKAGHFNVPMGEKTGDFPTLEEFIKATGMLNNVCYFCKDFEDVISDVKENDLVYLDPPYYSPRKRWRNEYGNSCFTTDDLPRLIRALEYIDKQNATFILSYADDSMLLDQLKEYHIHDVVVWRRICGFANQRKYAKEIILTNRCIQ